MLAEQDAIVDQFLQGKDFGEKVNAQLFGALGRNMHDKSVAERFVELASSPQGTVHCY